MTSQDYSPSVALVACAEVRDPTWCIEAAPLIAVHEAAHLLGPLAVADYDKPPTDGHGQKWREAFHTLLEAVNGRNVGTAFDRAVSGTAPCGHGSIV